MYIWEYVLYDATEQQKRHNLKDIPMVWKLKALTYYLTIAQNCLIAGPNQTFLIL